MGNPPLQDDDAAAQALALLYRHLPEVERPLAIKRTRESLLNQEVTLFATRSAGRVVGAILYHAAPGALGLVFLPRAEPGPYQAEIESALVQGVLARLRSQGAKQCQAILEPKELAFADALVTNGFAHVATLWCMRRRMDAAIPAVPAVPTHRFESFAVADSRVFQRTLERTYELSLDTPELNGVRTIEEEIVSHQQHGQFDPGRWWLLRDGGQPVGVLLLTAQVTNEAVWELLYMGLVPEARGRGWGKQMVHRALMEAANGKARWMGLTMDARNPYAFAIYESMGFERYDEREVLLAVRPLEQSPSEGK